MALTGKGWFIWQIARCEGGVPAAIADRAVASGTTHVLIKVAERTYTYNVDRLGSDRAMALATELRARGLQVWGWHYVYGDQPVDEAEIALRRVSELQLDGYVIDAESEYKMPGKAAAARRFMATLRAGLPANTLVALSSYRYPTYHPQLPWAAFLEQCDLAMPQVYWEQSHNPAQQLTRTVNEYNNPALVGFVRPIIPTGAAYGAGTWRAAPDELSQFLRAAVQLKLPAANFYSWDYATAPGHTALWDAVASFRWMDDSGQDVDGPVKRYFEALNTGDVERVLSCYTHNAAVVTPERTRVGHAEVAEWQAGFLADLAGATFTMHASSGEGNTRVVTWTALSDRAQVLDGEDTFGVVEGVIVYHFSRFTLTPTPDATLMPAMPLEAAVPVGKPAGSNSTEKTKKRWR